MRTDYWTLTVVAALLMLISPLCMAAEPPEELYQMALTEGRQLRVQRVPRLAAWRELEPLFGGGPEAQVASELRVLLEASDKTLILLASRLLWETDDPTTRFSSAAVVECKVEAGQVLLVFTAGSHLGVWRIMPVRGIVDSQIAWLDRWQVRPVATRLHAQSVNVRSSRDDKGNWTLQVADRRDTADAPPSFTTFVQEPDRWAFRPLGKRSLR